MIIRIESISMIIRIESISFILMNIKKVNK